MKRIAHLIVAFTLLMSVVASPASAAGTRVIVRVNGGLPLLQTVCRLLRCNVNYGLGDPGGQVFLITTPDVLSLNTFLSVLRLQLGVLSAEIDLQGNILAGSDATPAAPAALFDSTPVNYYGTSVRRGYVTQPASQIVGVASAQSQFKVDGYGIVAVIDTGVDPTHPVLMPVLMPGYDFTKNRDSADEKGDVQQSTAAVVDGVGAAWVNQSTAAVVDQSTAAVVDARQYAAFGHGTMVAGIIHLVAPKAMILPMKAFNADGSGYTSDVIRAIYKSVNANAKILNMSFSFASPSRELSNAITFANRNDVIVLAAVGNDGQKTTVYPAGYTDRVMGVASTSNSDARSSFSNFGSMVFVGAPGEGVVTTYPWGTYAAVWGTSFSTPFVAGAAALLLDVNTTASETEASAAIAHAKLLGSDLGNGRLDVYQAVAAWRRALGMK
jgi:subtilisin family serine protease